MIQFYCLLAGTLVPLAFAPFNFYFLAFLCPALLVFLCRECSPRRAFAGGYLFGFGMFATGVYWLHISINLFGGVTIVLAIMATALLVSFISLYPALVFYFSRRYFAKNELLNLLLVIPALWALLEWTRSWVLTGFPFLNMGYSQVDSPLSGFAPVLGVYGLGWLTILVSCLLVCALRYKDTKRWVAIGAIVVIGVSGWGLKQVNWSDEKDDTLVVALAQASIPQELKWQPQMRMPSLELYMTLSELHWQGDLVIWPETAIPAYPADVADFLDNLRALSRKQDVVFMSGMPSNDSDSGDYYNSIMMIDGDNTSWYHKNHLVPFGEYLPLKPLIGGIFDFLRIPMSNFSKGTRSKPVLEANKLIAGVSICYEGAFGEDVIAALPEADVLVNVSNDAWFGDSLAPHQQLQMARLRAIETGRYMLRATNNGISAIIDEKGQVLHRSTQFVPETLSAEVKRFSSSTPYARWGNYPVIFLGLVILGLVFALNRKESSSNEQV